MADRLLEVKDLSTHFFTHAGVVKAVNGVSFTLDRGETLGIVGESGSGKTSPHCRSCASSRTRPARSSKARSCSATATCARSATRRCAAVRGNDIAMIFQDPMTSLNPVHEGRQADRRGDHAAPGQAQERGVADGRRPARLGSASPTRDKRVDQYPFEFSGGMRQRAMIAMAISCNPDVLIADEPTTALDVTIQAQIIEVMSEMQAQFESGVILITHDLGVVAEIADKVMVMYGGRTVEYGSVDEIYYNAASPLHLGPAGARCRGSTSRRRRGSRPSRASRRTSSRCPPGCPFTARCPYQRRECRDNWPAHELVAPDHGVHCWIPIEERLAIRADLPHFKERGGMSLLEVRDLKKYFPIRTGVLKRTTGQVYAVDGISFTVEKGETLGLVGESGCGKSTAGRTVLRLIEATGRRRHLRGHRRHEGRSRSDMQTLRRDMQIIFQDPYASLNPRMRVRNIIGESLAHPRHRHRGRAQEARRRAARDRRAQRRARGALPARVLGRPAPAHRHRPRPGAQPQAHHLRRARERAGRVHPRPGLNLLEDLQDEFGLTYLFISHDLSVVKHISDRVAVMYLGKIVEIAGSDVLYDRPQHPYTEASALRRAHPGPEHGARAPAHRARGRRSEPRQPAERLRLPSALPAGAGDLHDGDAGARCPPTGRRRAPRDGLLLPGPLPGRQARRRGRAVRRRAARAARLTRVRRRSRRPLRRMSTISHASRFSSSLALAVALGAAVLAACGGAAATPPPRRRRRRTRCAPLVDGSRVHRSAVDAVRAEARLGGTSDAEARRSNEAIDRELVRQEAERLGVSADQTEVAMHAAGHGRTRPGASRRWRRCSQACRMTRQAVSREPHVRRPARSRPGRQLRRCRRQRGGGAPLLRRSPKDLFTKPASAPPGDDPVRSEADRPKRARAHAPRAPLRPRSRGSSPSTRSPRTPAATWAGSRSRSLPAPLRKVVETTQSAR